MKQLAIILVWVMCAVVADSLSAETISSFVLNESQVVPASGSGATGRAAATLDDLETQLSFIIEHDVTGPVQGAVYRGAAGANGTLSFTFGSAESPIVEAWSLSPADVTAFHAGDLYVEITSAGFPGGDVRGQIAPNADPQPGDVIITEIMYNPASTEAITTSAPEWIELFNNTDTDIEIGGWFFQDEDRESANPCTLMRSGSFPSFLLRSFEVVVVIPDGDIPAITVADFKTAWGLGQNDNVIQLNADGTAVGAIVGRNLGNSPFSDNNDANDLPLLIEPCNPESPTSHAESEVLTLNDGAQIIDIVNYDDSSPWPTDDGVASIALVPADYPTNTDFSTYDVTANNSGTNWIRHANGDAAGGRAQSAAAGVYEGADVGSPGFLVGATEGNQPPTADGEVRFVVPASTIDITLVGNDATRPFFGFLFFMVKSIPANGQLIDVADSHVITTGDVAGQGYLLDSVPFDALQYINDGTCGRTGFNFVAFDGLLQSPVTLIDLIVECGEVAVTEVMYDPDSFEDVPSLPEWVELYNTTASPIDLAGWYIEDDEGRCGDLPSYILGAGASVALIPSAADVAEFVSGWAGPVVQATTTSETSAGAMTGQNMNNTGDELRLVRPGGPLQMVSDAVYYLDGVDGWPQTFPDGSSIYVTPPVGNYSATVNDDPSLWAVSVAGTDGAYQVTPTPIYSGNDIGSPGILQGTTTGDCSAGAPSGDGNGDAAVDQADFEHFELCFSGPGGTPPLNCDCFDSEPDGDVDCDDWTAFETNWTGPPASPPVSAACPANCCGDFDTNNLVDLNDFLTLATCFGLAAPTAACPADNFECANLNGDAQVDLNDFLSFADFFGTTGNCN